MLVLTRKVGERIHLSNGCTLVLTKIIGNKARVGIEAPEDVKIVREELLPREAEERLLASVPQL
jgi:carbon storage regulator